MRWLLFVRIYRGGSWYEPLQDARLTYRNGDNSGMHHCALGLRLVRRVS